MTPLSNQQKQLLFDYCIGLTSEEQTAEAEALISAGKEAAEIHSKLKAALAPLDILEPEPCPDDLAESTIWRLNNAARSSQLRLQQLLADEQTREVAAKSRLWWNLGKTVAAAAVILIAVGIWFAPLNFARQKYWQHRCQMQLSRIFQGINNYSSDHNGKLPAVAAATGSPWWKVGYQGKENQSNTRHIWLLVRGGYVNPADFVCPGRREGRPIRLDALQVRNYSDFPGRKYVTYSFRIMCPGSEEGSSLGRKVLISDLNPLFERLPRDYSNSLKIKLTRDLLTLNSINHSRCGQNVLFGDGSVRFIKKRHTNLSDDDIFTLQGTDVYQGVEVPAYESDAFLAP